MEATLNLALVYRPEIFSSQDFVSIRREISNRCTDIEVFIVSDSRGVAPDPLLRKRPLMTFSPAPLQYFTPGHGKVFAGQKIRKDQQMVLLSKGGVRVPKWNYCRPDIRLSEVEWGPHVIVKPIAFGYASRGRGIELVKTTKFVYRPPLLAKIQGQRASSMIIQQFIDTGDYSEDYRVLTIFGRPLYAIKRKSLIKLVRPDGIATNRTSEGVVSNASAGQREATFCYEKDILAFATSCYRAIPQVALQAVDVRRDIRSGRLYCLEINPGGITWNFSSVRSQAMPTIDGKRREEQFGAWSIAAEALIENTRLFAS